MVLSELDSKGEGSPASLAAAAAASLAAAAAVSLAAAAAVSAFLAAAEAARAQKSVMVEVTLERK